MIQVLRSAETSSVHQPATSSHLVQGFENKPISRGIVVLFICFSSMVVYHQSIEGIIIIVRCSSIPSSQSTMTDSKYFSTTRKGKFMSHSYSFEQKESEQI